MIKLKIKKLAFINYFLFVSCIGLSWFYLIPTPHYLTTTIDQIDTIKTKFQRILDLNIEIKVDNIPAHLKSGSAFNDLIKAPLESSNKISSPLFNSKRGKNTIKDSGNSFWRNSKVSKKAFFLLKNLFSVFLSLDCSSKPETNTMEVLSLTEFAFKGDCQELETSKKLQREVKRVISSLTSGLTDDSHLNLAFGVMHFNVYIIVPIKNRNSTDNLKKRIIEIATPFAKRIGLSQKQYRLNFQV